jgi:hypothetical protein
MESVDDGIEVLTGLPAGAADPQGNYPDGSVNRRVEEKLVGLAEQAQARGGRADHANS